jgi:hypothetical protein
MCHDLCHIGTPLVNLTGCEIRFVLFGPDGRVTEWSLTTWDVRHGQLWMEQGSEDGDICPVGTIVGGAESQV